MSEPNVVIVRTGTANLASVVAGFKRIGALPVISDDPETIDRAERLVLPGVGTMSAAMRQLRETGLVDILKNRLLKERPTLAVCLGLQLLCDTSDENPGLKGLGIVPGNVSRFPDDRRVPQLGWNKVLAAPGCRFLADGYYYFANSYRLEEPPTGWKVAIADYGGLFVAAMERGPILACQFHPELSAQSGSALLKRWFQMSREMGGESC